MNWNDNGMHGWGYGLMGISMLLFWALAILAVVLLARYLGGQGRQTLTAQPVQRTPGQILAERFAHGDIDDEEYRRRTNVLRSNIDS